jgi:arginase
VVLGGDHTVAVGSVCGVRAGLRRRHGRRVPLFVLWLDAHPDANTAETSPTGHRHGMVLAGLLGEGPLAVVEPLPAAHMVVAGARSLDPGELDFLRARPELALWDVEVLRSGAWRAAAEALLARVAAASGRLYVSLDLDVLDPAFAPGVAVPARHGALPGPLLALLRRLRASGLVAGADVVELYPPADEQERTASLAAAALSALGAARRARPRPEQLASLSERRPAAGPPPSLDQTHPRPVMGV